MAFPNITGIDMTADCHECCEVPVDCPDCPSIPTTWLFTIVAAGDLAFLNGGTVTINYAGFSGGFFNWVGTATIGGCDITVGWGMEDNNVCTTVFGDISVDCPACDGPQSFAGGEIAASWSFSCTTPSFTCNTASELLEWGTGSQCFFGGTIGGTAVPA